MIDKSDLLVSSVYNRLFSSAMTHKDCKWSKLESAKAINQKESEWLCSSFNDETWGSLNKSGFSKVKYFKSTRNHMSTYVC